MTLVFGIYGKTSAPWEQRADGRWYKASCGKFRELIKRNSDAVEEGGWVSVANEAHTKLLDRGLYLPRD